MLPRILVRRALLPALFGCLLMGAAACGGDDGEGLLAGITTTDAPPASTTTAPEEPVKDADDADVPSGDFCTAAADIAALDEEYSGQVAAALSPAMEAAAAGDEAAMDRALEVFLTEIQSIGELLPALDAGYGDLFDAAPPELQTDVVLVRTFTNTLVEELMAASSFEDLEALTESTEEMQSGALAAMRLDLYTRENCGFSLNNE